jgi:hypothetical protein
MDTAGSTSATTDPATSADAATSREWRVASLAEQAAAIDLLLDLAQHRVQVFDVDLSQCGWDTPRRAEALARFLHKPDVVLQVIVHDTRWIEAQGARLCALLRQFSSAITLYRTGAEARHAMDPLLLVDQRHFLHRFHVDQPRASVAVDQPQLAKPLCARFDEIWATGEPGLAATVLGL